MADEKNESGAPRFQPGAVISPGGAPAPPASQPEPPTPAQPELEPTQPQPIAQPDVVESVESPAPTAAIESADEITWTASEFIAHEKNANWYMGLGVAAIIIGALIYLVTRDFISIAVVVVAALMFGVYGSRKPRQMEYRLDQHGISIGPKHYPYGEFRTFSVMSEGAFSSIVFMPLKRFGTPVTLYYAPEDEERIMNLLAQQLPFEPQKRDPVDSLMRHLRF